MFKKFLLAGAAMAFTLASAPLFAKDLKSIGISLGSLVGGEAIALGSFGADLTVSAGIALTGCIVNAILVPSRERMTQ